MNEDHRASNLSRSTRHRVASDLVESRHRDSGMDRHEPKKTHDGQQEWPTWAVSCRHRFSIFVNNSVADVVLLHPVCSRCSRPSVLVFLDCVSVSVVRSWNVENWIDQRFVQSPGTMVCTPVEGAGRRTSNKRDGALVRRDVRKERKKERKKTSSDYRAGHR